MKYQELINLLENNNFKLINEEKRGEYTLYQNDNSVITEFDCDDKDEAQECLIQSIKYHIDKINENDPEYFDGCDEKYLKTTWKKLLKNILLLINNEEKRLDLINKQNIKINKELKAKKNLDYGLSL